MPISKVHSSYGGNNKGSSSLLANYLDKENKELEKLASKENSHEKASRIRNQKQGFFNHDKTNVSQIEVINNIDSNIKKLGKKDSKYFSPTINFSKEELKHISKLATDGKKIQNVPEMTPEEFKKYNDLIQNYTKKAMDNYAENFNRQEKGLKNGSDLVYYAKIEHSRKYKGTDIEVKKGLIKAGKNKPGLQTHIHVIVSRKDKTQRLKLTPTTNEKNNVRKIGNNSYRVGFDRKEWISKNEQTFDSFFQYERPLTEKVKNQNILKNGSPEEREELIEKINLNKEKGLEFNQEI